SMEYYRKDENQYYFFGEIDDSLEYDEQKQPGDEAFEVKAIVHPYRVIFAFNTATGEFAVTSAKLRIKQADELAMCLVQRLLGSLRGMRRISTKSNDLRKLACHGHILDACRNTVVTRVYLNEVKFFTKLFPNIMIAFNHKQHGSVAQAIRDFAGMNSQGLEALCFQEVGLGVEYRSSYKTESFSFRITENDTTLRNQPEHRRKIGREVLESLGVQSA
ncbi:MAG: hypothetical protein MJ202_05355, partial [Lentisphaeria bacterium]|nr:hypothetical protein [Lentisphaeria bacterium]